MLPGREMTTEVQMKGSVEEYVEKIEEGDSGIEGHGDDGTELS
jgi:hypothetical protein